MRVEGQFIMQNVRGRRDRHEIITEILESARGGTKKTHIMYKARLSSSQIGGYLDLLIGKGYLESLTVAKRKQVHYLLKTSKSGEELLQTFRKLNV